MRQDFRSQTESMKADHQAEIKNLSSSHERMMEMRKSELIKDKQMAIEKLTSEHSSEVKKI